jgi:hypothetical protein
MQHNSRKQERHVQVCMLALLALLALSAVSAVGVIIMGCAPDLSSLTF